MTSPEPAPPPLRLEDVCLWAAYLALPAGGVALAVRWPWVAVLIGVAAFPIAVKGRIGGFIQLPLAIGYVTLVAAGVLQLIR